MAKEQIPITKEVVVWARTRAGLSIVDASKKFREIEQWETGTAFPTYPQLEKLAEELKVPVAVFFFPEPPKTPPIRESFRTLPDTEFDKMPRRIRFLLRKAKALQLNLPELTQGRNPAPRMITRELRFRDTAQLDDMATRVREFLGITIEQQIKWADDDTALEQWRSALQNVGVFVFKDAFKAEGYSGFSLYDELFPIIYVNNSATKTRQTFTLFHELAHLLFHTSGIDTIEDPYIPSLPLHQKRIEILCNSLAARLLVPEAAFLHAVKGLDHTERTAELLAARFHVSREVIFRKFLDRDWIDEAHYARAVKHWASQKKRRAPGGNPYWTKIAYLGREYISLAFSQHLQNRIDEKQLAEYLDTKPKHINTLEGYFARGAQ